MSIPLLADYTDILATIWQMLADGVRDRDDPFHTPVIGTVGAQGCNMRTVVLREVDPADRLLMCHTDTRSGKMNDMRQHPRSSWLFYHPGAKIQVRLTGQATIHTTDEIAEQAWERTALLSRRCYCGEAPGLVKDAPASGLPDTLHDREPTEAESAVGRPHFAVIRCQIDWIDWLQLHFAGHRRAQFMWDEQDRPTATWMTP